MAEPANDAPAHTSAPSERDLLFTYLRDNDAPCPVCGYNLRQLTHDVCPECGQQFTLRIGSVHTAFGYLLAFLAPMIMVTGLGLVFAALLLALGPPGGAPWGLYATIAMGFADAVAVILLYRRRAVFLRRATAAQRLLVILSWGFHSVTVTLVLRFGVN